ncbi:ABC transporter permease [Streptomyces sp. CA-253872]|uniref:ABC transporter permease n=1 Tax=Streptomyces sp. CA-253872 TaxID=3240067 RepID=UPI003D8C8CCF
MSTALDPARADHTGPGPDDTGTTDTDPTGTATDPTGTDPTGTGTGTQRPEPGRKGSARPAAATQDPARPGRARAALGHIGDVAALTGRHLRHLRRTPEKIIGVALTPVAMVVILGYLFATVVQIKDSGNSYREYIMAGVFAQVGLSCIGITAIGVAGDLGKGLMDRFRSLPMGRATVLASHTLADLGAAALSMLLVAVTGLAVGWRVHGSFGEVLLGFVLQLAFAYAMLWLGALLGMMMRNAEAISGVAALMLVLLSFLSSSFMPLTGLPGWLRTLAEWNPVSAVSEACRRLWGNTGAVTSGSFPVTHPVTVSLISVGLVIAVLVPLSLRAYRTSATR